ncbi:uncharacterized protein RAG0_11782 [Rhynchosporium agropyri]|uniref:Uncharacterized protein n=1 Tax=Rhynchosporium agropyri TaxID=914238 RepID=A0A1E1L8A2_9HELO|nr:uncharacterized protein RAG0_11782 [Rhynchosporium agropyri]
MTLGHNTNFDDCFSVSSRRNVVLSYRSYKVEEHMGSTAKGFVMEAFEAEKSTNPGFTIPAVDGLLRYVTVSSPPGH